MSKLLVVDSRPSPLGAGPTPRPLRPRDAAGRGRDMPDGPSLRLEPGARRGGRAGPRRRLARAARPAEPVAAAPSRPWRVSPLGLGAGGGVAAGPRRRVAVAARVATCRPVGPRSPRNGWCGVGVVIADGDAEAESFRRLGVAEDRLRVVAPGVEIPRPGRAGTAARPAGGRQSHARPGADRADQGAARGGVGSTSSPTWRTACTWFSSATAPTCRASGGSSRSTCREDRTHFVGEVADLGPWLARADVVVAAGVGGGRMAILDAMAAGRPVVATRTPDRAELIDHGRTGLFARPKDIPDLCRQIKAVLDDAALARMLGRMPARRWRRGSASRRSRRR